MRVHEEEEGRRDSGDCQFFFWTSKKFEKKVHPRGPFLDFKKLGQKCQKMREIER
jgi:hypothetical protein